MVRVDGDPEIEPSRWWEYEDATVARQQARQKLAQVGATVAPLVEQGDFAGARAAVQNATKPAGSTADAISSFVGERLKKLWSGQPDEPANDPSSSSLFDRLNTERAQTPETYTGPRITGYNDGGDSSVTEKVGSSLRALWGGAQHAAAKAVDTGEDVAGAAGDVAGKVAEVHKDAAAGALHGGLQVANKALSFPAEHGGKQAFAALTGETSAGRHPIYDEQGNITGYYRDAPDMGDMASSLWGLLTDPAGELGKGKEAFNERLANPEQNAVSRGVLGAGANPLTYAFGPGGAAANIATSVGTEALNENADAIPGYRDLSPDVQQLVQLAAPVVAGKVAGPLIEKAGAKVPGAAKVAGEQYQGSPLAAETGELNLGAIGDSLKAKWGKKGPKAGEIPGGGMGEPPAEPPSGGMKRTPTQPEIKPVSPMPPELTTEAEFSAAARAKAEAKGILVDSVEPRYSSSGTQSGYTVKGLAPDGTFVERGYSFDALQPDSVIQARAARDAAQTALETEVDNILGRNVRGSSEANAALEEKGWTFDEQRGWTKALDTSPGGAAAPGGHGLPMVQVGPFELPDITPQPLSKTDITMNALKRSFGLDRYQEDTIATPAMRARAAAKPVIDSQAARLAATSKSVIDAAFPNRDATGRVTDLPGSPTIQTIAARLPDFLPHLDPKQVDAMAYLRNEVAPYRDLLEKVGVDVHSRADVAEGGFYLPRGRADLEGADAPVKVGSGRSGGVGGKKGFEKGAVFDSMEQGIDAGYRYAPLEEALQSYAKEAGNRAMDSHIASYFKNVTDGEGNPLGQTFADRIPEGMQGKVDALRGDLNSLSGKLATAEKRAGIAQAKAAELATPLQKLRSGVIDRETARTALADARKELTTARTEALSDARSAGGAAARNQAAIQRADAAIQRLDAVQREALGYGEVAPTGMGVRLPALQGKAVDAAVEAADLSTKELRAMGREKASAETAVGKTAVERGIAEDTAGDSRAALKDSEKTAVAAAQDLAPEAVFSTMRQLQRRADALTARGDKWSGLADSIRQELDGVRRRYEEFLPEWQRAKERAYQTPRDQGGIGFAQLNGTTFPDAVANAANKWLEKERPATGQGATLIHTVNGFNNLLRAWRATLDASFMGIQGLMAGARHPADYARALGLAFHAFSDKNALGKYIVEYDRKSLAQGLPTSKELIANGLHIGGADTEFALKGGLPGLSQKLQNAKGVAQSNRMFGYFGDGLRLELARTAYSNAVKSGIEMTPKRLAEITQVSNLATGWSPRKFGGDLGTAAEFAPRFFQSQLEFVYKGLTDWHSLTGSEARQMMGALVGQAALLTTGVNYFNEQTGNPYIPWDQLFDPRSSNFMRMRIAGQDVSPLGPWDSLAKGFVQIGDGMASAGKDVVQGDIADAPGDAANGLQYFARSKASPALGTAWDVLSGETFTGDKASLTDPEYLLRSFLPMSVSDIGQKPLLSTAIGLTGLKATPITPTEELDQLARSTYGASSFYDLKRSEQDALKASHPDLWQRAIERGSSARQQYEGVKQQLTTQQQGSDDQFLSGQLTRENWLKQYQDRKTKLAGAQLAIYGNKPITNPRNSSERYAQILQQNQDPQTGEYNWDAVDAAVAKLSPADQAWIEDSQNTGSTPIVRAYKKAADLRGQYYDISPYVGYTADEARQLDEAWTAVRSMSRSADRVQMLSAMNRMKDLKGQYPPKVLNGVRRRIVGLITPTDKRARFAKAHPQMAIFYGGNGKAGALTPGEVTMLQQMAGN